MESYNQEAVKLSLENRDCEVYVLSDGGTLLVSLLDEMEIGVDGFWCVEKYENGKRTWKDFE